MVSGAVDRSMARVGAAVAELASLATIPMAVSTQVSRRNVAVCEFCSDVVFRIGRSHPGKTLWQRRLGLFTLVLNNF